MASYRVEVDRQVQKELRRLPGNVRQRVLRSLTDLRKDPRPTNSRALDTSKLELSSDPDLHRIRLESWRILYLIEEDERRITVFAIRKRPPYQYDDLVKLLEG